MPPPPGVTPNFDNPDRSLQATWLAGLLVCLIVPTILVALRLYVKVYVIKNTTVTDCTLLLNTLPTSVFVNECSRHLLFSMGMSVRAHGMSAANPPVRSEMLCWWL